MDRRKWMRRLVHVGGAAVAAALAVPAFLMAISPALQRRPEMWVRVGPLDEFAVGNVVKQLVELPEPYRTQTMPHKAVFVWRPSEDEIVVYSRNCTDLSCPLTWDEGSGWFYCPCHGGIFSIEGEPVAGPPDRPMYRYAMRVRNGMVEIDLTSLPPMT